MKPPIAEMDASRSSSLATLAPSAMSRTNIPVPGGHYKKTLVASRKTHPRWGLSICAKEYPAYVFLVPTADSASEAVPRSYYPPARRVAGSTKRAGSKGAATQITRMAA